MLNSEIFFYQNFNRNENFHSLLLAQQAKQNQKFQDKSPTVKALKNIFKVIYLCFL